MKSNALELFLIFLLLSSFKQPEAVDAYERIYKYHDGAQWAFINNHGDTVISFNTYSYLNEIDECGMILAESVEGKWGYIDIWQNILIPFEYEDLGVFRYNEVAPAKKEGKYGYIDRNENIVIPFQYNSKQYFRSTGLAVAQKEKQYGFINITGNEVVPIIYEDAHQIESDSVLILKKDGKWAFFSPKGKPLTDFIYSEIFLSETMEGKEFRQTFFGNGPVLVERNEKIAYLNSKLEEIIPFGVYDEGMPFNANRFAIVAKDAKYGIIDEKGNLVVDTLYDLIEHPAIYSSISETFVLKKDNLFQLLNKELKPITDFNITDYIWTSVRISHKPDEKNVGEDYVEHVFILETNKNGAYVISENGNMLIPENYQKIFDFENKVAVAQKDNRYGLINTEGSVVFPFIFDTIYSYGAYYKIKQDEKWGLMDKETRIIIDPCYEALSTCYYDKTRLIVKLNNKCGIINLSQEVLVPLEYDTISNWLEYISPMHFVVKDGMLGIISIKDEVCLPPVYDRLFYCNDDCIVVQKNGKQGVVTIKNQIVIPLRYDELYADVIDEHYEFQEPAEWYVKRNGKYFTIDKHNKILRRNIPEEEVKTRFPYNCWGITPPPPLEPFIPISSSF